MNTSVKMKNKAEIFNLKKYSVANGNLITLNYPQISFLEKKIFDQSQFPAKNDL